MSKKKQQNLSQQKICKKWCKWPETKRSD